MKERSRNLLSRFSFLFSFLSYFCFLLFLPCFFIWKPEVFRIRPADWLMIRCVYSRSNTATNIYLSLAGFEHLLQTLELFLPSYLYSVNPWVGFFMCVWIHETSPVVSSFHNEGKKYRFRYGLVLLLFLWFLLVSVLLWRHIQFQKFSWLVLTRIVRSGFVTESL